MNQRIQRWIIAFFATVIMVVPHWTWAQGGGGYGGYGGGGMYGSGTQSDVGSGYVSTFPSNLRSEEALNFITIEGSAVTRLMPEEIRVVMAVISEDETADACQKKVDDRVAKVTQGWRDISIPRDKIDSDFIAVLPRYEWRLVERDGETIRMQKLAGYRMQTNLHVSVSTEAKAMKAIYKAFQSGVTDIITFDYWSPKLDEQKDKVRESAVAAARKKAELLLDVFADTPKVINVREKTTVHFPNTLYQTFQNVLEEQTESWNSRRDKPMIKAFRPKMTFLSTIQGEFDVRPKKVMMKPEIVVTSRVQLIYQSPAEPSRTHSRN